MQNTHKSIAINHLFSQGAFTLLASGFTLAARKWVTIPSFLSLPAQIFSAVILGIVAKFAVASHPASPASPASTYDQLEAHPASPVSPASTYDQLKAHQADVQQALKTQDLSREKLFKALKPLGDANELPISQKMQSLAKELLDFIQKETFNDNTRPTINDFIGSSLRRFLEYASEQGYITLGELHKTLLDLSPPPNEDLICQGLQALAQATKPKDNERPCSSLRNMDELFTRAVLKGPTPERPGSKNTQLELGQCLGAFNGLVELERILSLEQPDS